MRKFLPALLLLLIAVPGLSQETGHPVVDRMKRLHQMMIEPRFYIDQYLHDHLSYGHSNGWIQNKNEFVGDMGKKITYHSFKEDSIAVTIDKREAHIRFVADIEATMNGVKSKFHLRVMEVWIKKNRSWKLYARQAFK